MKIDILTLFPEMFVPLRESIIGRAVENGRIEINLVNIRDFPQINIKNATIILTAAARAWL